MHIDLLLFCILIMTFAMVVAKRITALVNSFSIQSLFLSLTTLIFAINGRDIELYIIAGLLFILKVILVPYFLHRTVKKIKINENLGLFINPQLSLFIALLLVYSAYLFSGRFILLQDKVQNLSFIVSFSVTLIGFFIMIFRMKALAQIIGLLVMENGLFLAGTTVCGGMPFFVEIAIFFDIFVCVVILGIFVFRINKLFTHIDVSKLAELKG